MGLGFVPDLLILGVVLGVPVASMVVLYGVLSGRRAKQFGYGSTRAYLRAAPRSDEERRDAADLALKGVVFCLIAMPSTTMGALVLAAGLVLYVAGLFGPLGNRSQP